MAGIGFVLRRLYRQDNLSGLVGAGINSAFASAGPWLFTVLALGMMAVIGKDLVGVGALFKFRVILIYNFSFSLVLSGAIFMVATRVLSDAIFSRDVSSAPSMLFGALILLLGIDLIFAVPFYFYAVDVGLTMALSATVNFMLLSCVWLVGIFIAAMKNYRLITRSFFGGMLVATFASLALARGYGDVGLLNGFSMGIAVTTALLFGNILAEYPFPIRHPFAFLPAFRRYWDIALGGLVYNLAVWADKWVMWFAPQATRMDSGLLIYPHYDAAMFLAYLTTIPAMALFLFNVETHFFERYIRFYRDIENKASLAGIEQDHRAIERSLADSARSLFLFQAGLVFVSIMLAPSAITLLKGVFMQIGMLRFGLLGAMFQVFGMFLLVLLSYFGARKESLAIQIVFLATNVLFTWASIHAGFQYYGMGYFLSTFTTFILAAQAVKQHLSRLPYHTFVTTNSSVS